MGDTLSRKFPTVLLFIIKQQNLLALLYNISFDFNVDGYLIFESFQCIFK